MKLKTVPSASGGKKNKPTMIIPTPVTTPPPGGLLPGQRTLSQPARVVQGQAEALAVTVSGIGVDSTVARDPAGEDTLILQVDPKGPTLARKALVHLPPDSLIVQRSGVNLGKLKVRADKLDKMTGFLCSTVSVAADVEDSRAVVGSLQRQERINIRARVLAYLPADGMPMTDAQRRLQAIWNPVKEMEQKQQAQDAAKQDLGKKRSKRRAAELLAQTQQEDLLKTIIDAKNGVPIDEQRAAQAVSTWEQGQKSDMADVAEALSPAAEQRRGKR